MQNGAIMARTTDGVNVIAPASDERKKARRRGFCKLNASPLVVALVVIAVVGMVVVRGVACFYSFLENQ